MKSSLSRIYIFEFNLSQNPWKATGLFIVNCLWFIAFLLNEFRQYCLASTNGVNYWTKKFLEILLILCLICFSWLLSLFTLLQSQFMESMSRMETILLLSIHTLIMINSINFRDWIPSVKELLRVIFALHRAQLSFLISFALYEQILIF